MSLNSLKKAELIEIIERERATHIRHYAERVEWDRKEREKLTERLEKLDTNSYQELEATIDNMRCELVCVRAYLESNDVTLVLPVCNPARRAYEEAMASLDVALT